MSRKPFLSRLTAAALVIAASGAGLAACGNAFDDPATLQSLRVMGVKVSPAYGKPGAKVKLEMLEFDGSKRAYLGPGVANPDHHLQLLWIGGCHDPAGDLYYGCYPVIAELFKNIDISNPSPTNLPPEVLKNVGIGPTFELTIPDDIISRRPPPKDSNTAYGLSFVFFVACGGKLGPPPPGAQTAFPIGCYDEQTGAALGADDFVVGYTPIYTYDTFTNENPIIEGGSYEGKASMNTACTDDAICGANQKCGKAGACIPVVPHCTSRKIKDCQTYVIKPGISRASVEKDPVAADNAGNIPDESIWVAYFTSNGALDSNSTLRLVNDPVQGWNDSFETKWSPPNAPAGESRIWAVVHDNRGGTGWWFQDVFVNLDSRAEDASSGYDRDPMKPRTSRLAASFVVTVAALPGCQKAAPESAPAENAAPTPTVAVPSNMPSPNPPAVKPTATASASATAATPPQGEAPPGSKLCSATDGMRPCIDKLDDGTCKWMPGISKCPPGRMCNPPPPRAVACPLVSAEQLNRQDAKYARRRIPDPGGLGVLAVVSFGLITKVDRG